MANVSSLGIGSGINAEALVSSLMQVEQQPLTLVKQKETTVNAKISAFGTIRSLLDTLKTASNTLSTPSKLAAFTATSSTAGVMSATASSTAVAGNYGITVQQLASAHKVSNTTAIAGDSTATIGAGTFTLQLAGATSATTLTMGASATLGDLRDAINASSSGITANIVTGNSQSRLVLTASETGKAITTSTTIAGFGTFQTVGAPHTVTSQTAFAGSGDRVGAGTLNITVGTTTTAVALASTTASLQDVANAINTASVGATASVVTDTTGTRLKLVAGDPDKLISYTAVDDDATDGYDFSRLRGFSTVGQTPQIAQSALVTIEGQEITSTSNTITSAISGVSLNLTATGSTTLTVARNKDAVKTAVDSFISAYNGLNTKIRSLTAYDATNKTANTLTGDSTARSLQTQLSSLLISTPGTPTGTYSALADIGITTGTDGSLSVDATKLQTAIDNDFASTSDVLNRYGSALYTKVGDFTATRGLLSGKTDSLSSMLTEYSKQKESIQLRLTAIEKRYRAQFTALDTMVSSMQTTSTYLTQQLAKL